MHNLVLLPEVIVFAVISLLVGLFLEVLLFATSVIIASIIAMVTMVLAFVAIALVASMVVAVLATMMPMVWVMTPSNREMSCLLLLQLLLLLELVQDTNCFVGSLALLKKGHEPKRVRGHRFVCFRILKLMCLSWARKICLLFSCVMGSSIVWRRQSLSR